MGVYDRPYMQGRRGPGWAVRSWTVRLLLLLAATFVVDHGAAGWFRTDVTPWFALSRRSLEEGRVWTLLTSALLHADAWHLVSNGIGLWFFGRLVEDSLGGARFLWFCAIAAVVSHVPFLVAEYATGGSAWTIGASGVVMAVLVFAALRFPGLPVVLFVIPMRLWHLALVYVAFDVFGALQRGGHVDHWTHLGGAAYGLVVHRFGLLPGFEIRLPRPRRARGPLAGGNGDRVDAILDKINEKGIAALTDEEREFLRRHAKR